MLTELVALFGAGVASFLAPCVVPLVPAYLGAVAGDVGEHTDSTRAVAATARFVLGFTCVFAGLGALAAVVGSSLARFSDVVQVVGGVVIILMGLVLLDVVRGPFLRERRLVEAVSTRGGATRPFVVGVAFGAGWSPCVGPLLAAALAVAAADGGVVRGTLLLIAYAMGIGAPFMIAAFAFAAWPGIAPALRRVGPALRRISGGLLIVLGVLLVTGWYDHLTSYLARFAPAVGGL